MTLRGIGEKSEAANPPRMVCYRPKMKESDLIQSLHRFVMSDELQTTLHSGPMAASKHTMRPKHGYNDVSRYTWSSV